MVEDKLLSYSLKFLKSVILGYVIWFPAFVISYTFWSAVWALTIAGRFYEQSDPVIFLTDFLPPFVNPHFDHYLNGGSDTSVLVLWYMFMVMILISSLPVYFLIKKYVKGLVREIESQF